MLPSPNCPVQSHNGKGMSLFAFPGNAAWQNGQDSAGGDDFREKQAGCGLNR